MQTKPPEQERPSLERGARLPTLRVRRTDGAMFDDAEVWQRRNLLLVRVPADDALVSDEDAARWLRALDQARPDLQRYEAAVVVTRDDVAGLSAPGVVVADRWGEVQFVALAARTAELPDVATLMEWLRFVDHACPECEGEAR